MKHLAAVAALAGVLASACSGTAQGARATVPAAPLPAVFQNGAGWIWDDVGPWLERFQR